MRQNDGILRTSKPRSLDHLVMVERIFLPVTIILASAGFMVSSSRSIMPAVAQTFPSSLTYQTNSPHWSHINILDFGTNVWFLPDGLVRQAGFEWYARHVDSMHIAMDTFAYRYDQNTKAAMIKNLNPTIKAMGYDIDLFMCQHMTCYDGNPVNTAQQNLPEEYYLHFSQNTRVEYFDTGSTTLLGAVDIPGCPEPGPVTSECRVQLHNYGSNMTWLPNTKNAAWREWFADHLLEQMSINGGQPNPIDVLFFDGHGGPGFSESLCVGSSPLCIWGLRSAITSGGAIREYGGQVPRDGGTEPINELDREYSADISNWLTYLRGRLATVGKTLRINTGTDISDPLVMAQAEAANGFLPEYLHSAVGFTLGNVQYQPFLTNVRRVTAAGGTVDLHYRPCSDNQPGMTSGNFDTAVNRFRMWNLASYYMAKESTNEPGMVYFDPAFCISSSSMTPVQDLDAQWLAAYEKDVGLPIGEPIVVQTGPDDCLYNGDYYIYSRQYAKALVIVRPRGGYWCQDYGDSTIVNVPLKSPMSILQSDGTLSVPMNSVPIRNAEAVILMIPPDTTPPAAVNDLRVS